MPPKPTGQVIEKETREGRTYALRFRAYGERQYVTLGATADGWTRERAERELRHVLADVERGIWVRPVEAPVTGPSDPGFHAFASQWLEDRRGEIRPNTVADYTWQICNHLLPFFHRHRLSQITVGEVDRYRAFKVKEGELGAESINKTITRLGQILAVAEERDLIARNPVSVNARNRKLKARRPRPVFLDSAESIQALLDAASELDGREHARTDGRRALIATLVFAGLRISEACGLRWRQVGLASGRIVIGDAKTEAGARDVDLVPILRDELDAYKLGRERTGPDDHVFTTANGRPRDRTNARQRVIVPVVERADELLARRGQPPLPEGVTAHKLRHTFASVLVMLDGDPAYVMSQLGHTDPAFTLRVYAHAMRRDEGAKERLRALVNGVDWAPLGTGDPNESANAPEPTPPQTQENPADAGLSVDGRGGFRTCDLSRVKRLHPTFRCIEHGFAAGSGRRS
jgi:integrase